MRKLAGFIFIIGIVLIAGAGMFAFDSYMTDDRRSAVHGEINTRLDEGAEQYEQNREEGCRRSGCGFFAGISSMTVAIRDGIFLPRPFDPDTVFVETKGDWIQFPYDLEMVETIVDWEIERTPVRVSTSNRLVQYFDYVASLRRSGSVKIYVQDDNLIAMAVRVLNDGIRAGKSNSAPQAADVPIPFVTIDGLPVRDYPKINEVGVGLGQVISPVDYRHLSMDFDGQVEVTIVALAEDAKIIEFLSGFDVSLIVDGLPQRPAGYTAGVGIVQNTEPPEASE